MAWSNLPDRIAMTKRTSIICQQPIEGSKTHHLLDKVRTDKFETDIEDRGERILVSDTDKVTSELFSHTDVFTGSSGLERITP